MATEKVSHVSTTLNPSSIRTLLNLYINLLKMLVSIYFNINFSKSKISIYFILYII
jgi:hypothetical protein